MVVTSVDLLESKKNHEYDDPILDSIFIPEYVKKFKPTPDVIQSTSKGGTKVRFIFSNVDFSDFENEHIRNFKIFATQRLDGPQLESNSAVESYQRRFKNTVFGNDGYILRYLISNGYNYSNVLNDMYNHLKWRKSTLPIKRVDIESDLAKGFVYIHGRDKCMRPIIIIRCSNMQTSQHEHILKTIYFVLELCIEKLLIPGQIEQWKVIIDLDGTNLFNIPASLLKQIAKSLSVNYRARLSKLYVINAPYLISVLWNIVKNVIPQITQEKIVISSGKNTKKLLEVALPSQIEQRYGGKAPNVKMFDIPIMPEL
ncbi:CRAL/TRIO domain protein [Theileria parva strain Muguga]|uniref:CRAL-TRIO domain-containing protein n=1 Tax=Theileria parva TaxID=5875 RepID=Q4N0W0_THEPA|nr:CRAL/TRIO domain protein [Theileria parva strain Muguga]EAN30864.1 CRAL/TRIO domain protein [Theileria parva strain Muguga]|eukprot:XP_763147.1 hypothetical protein [Theileria parva strain Muguga]